MSAQKICRMGHPALRAENQELTKEEILSKPTQKLIKDMIDSMNKAGGIGIAAPQIGINKMLTIIELDEDSERYDIEDGSDLLVIINPKITIMDNELQGFWEGCLSVPGLRGYVERPRKIKVNFLNEKAEEKEIIAEDFLATVFQHEIDHLFGILYVDKVQPGKLVYEDEFDEYILEEE